MTAFARVLRFPQQEMGGTASVPKVSDSPLADSLKVLGSLKERKSTSKGREELNVLLALGAVEVADATKQNAALRAIRENQQIDATGSIELKRREFEKVNEQLNAAAVKKETLWIQTLSFFAPNSATVRDVQNNFRMLSDFQQRLETEYDALTNSYGANANVARYLAEYSAVGDVFAKPTEKGVRFFKDASYVEEAGGTASTKQTWESFTQYEAERDKLVEKLKARTALFKKSGYEVEDPRVRSSLLVMANLDDDQLREVLNEASQWDKVLKGYEVQSTERLSLSLGLALGRNVKDKENFFGEVYEGVKEESRASKKNSARFAAFVASRSRSENEGVTEVKSLLQEVKVLLGGKRSQELLPVAGILLSLAKPERDEILSEFQKAGKGASLSFSKVQEQVTERQLKATESKTELKAKAVIVEKMVSDPTLSGDVWSLGQIASLGEPVKLHLHRISELKRDMGQAGLGRISGRDALMFYSGTMPKYEAQSDELLQQEVSRGNVIPLRRSRATGSSSSGARSGITNSSYTDSSPSFGCCSHGGCDDGFLTNYLIYNSLFGGDSPSEASSSHHHHHSSSGGSSGIFDGGSHHSDNGGTNSVHSGSSDSHGSHSSHDSGSSSHSSCSSSSSDSGSSSSCSSSSCGGSSCGGGD